MVNPLTSGRFSHTSRTRLLPSPLPISPSITISKNGEGNLVKKINTIGWGEGIITLAGLVTTGGNMHMDPIHLIFFMGGGGGWIVEALWSPVFARETEVYLQDSRSLGPQSSWHSSVSLDCQGWRCAEGPQ